MGTWSSYAALYYPYATFGNEHWLRQALLFWDSVSLIRPAGLETALAERGPVEQAIAREEPDFLDPLTPHDEELQPVSEDIIEAEAVSFDALRHRYGPAARAALTTPARPTRQAAPAHADPRLVWVYTADRDSKVSWFLADQLLRHTLADEDRDERGERWLGLHPRFAAVYLTALAAQMARRRGLIALTDDVAVHRAAGPAALDTIDQALAGDRASGTRSLREVQAQYLHVAVTALPEAVDLDQVPVAKLLAFRHTHYDQITAFRAHLSGLEDKLLALAAVDDPEALRKRLRELYRQETEPLLNDLRDSMHRFGLRTVLGTLALKIDMETAGATLAVLGATTVATATTGTPAIAITAPAAIAMAVVPYLAQRRAARRQLADSPVSFLLSAGREMSAGQVLRDMRG
ncbi:MAG TPA: DUF6236 family protein [Pseudonocardiaceae bacterium]